MVSALAQFFEAGQLKNMKGVNPKMALIQAFMKHNDRYAPG